MCLTLCVIPIVFDIVFGGSIEVSYCYNNKTWIGWNVMVEIYLEIL